MGKQRLRPDAIKPDAIKRIAFINFGGIGDEILFAPVIEDVRRALPQAHCTLFLERRSQSVKDLLTIDAVVPLQVQGQSRQSLFAELWNRLRTGDFDAVISSGSSPFIPVLLFASGIPVRVGFQTGAVSRALLTTEAPLAPRHARKGYAADMYFALASSFLRYLLGDAYQPMRPVLPHLKPPSEADRQWAASVIPPHPPGSKILIHPGVSAISVQKNILKGWPPARWAECITQLCQQGHQVYLAGGPDDAETIDQIQQALPATLNGFHSLYGQTKNLLQLGALVLAADVLIGVDSSPMHLAVGYQKPVVAIFGPTDERKLLPPNDARFQAVTVENLSCRPCLWDVRNENCATSDCLQVPVSLVLAKVQEVLQGAASPAI
ncbi:glycosyltransferase family 9 protein [Vampirovibrio chlorellavorus]|uniref:glycosyltransferase family 9 protein n=1 Tax=Vampirovibrio chlorellavorus TaxID=758823 RepID=UPI0026EEE7DD|nr:glycosyltransferase family 9 protein [Vampirovibrio chlorellavorus]